MNERPVMRPANESQDPLTPTDAVTQKAGAFFDKMGVGRMASAVILIVMGFLVILVPEILAWTIGIGAIVFGIMIAAQAMR